jgi:hypothetical protein
VYVKEQPLSPRASTLVGGADRLPQPTVASATPEELERLGRSRRAASEVLAALARRDAPQLSARYGLRYESPGSAGLLRLVDYRSGPASLEIRSVGDPAERASGAQVVLAVALEFRYRSMAGRMLTRRAQVDLHCLARGDSLEIVEIVPVAGEY